MLWPVLLVAGCSSFKSYVIENLDWFIMKEIEDTFDLSDDQYALFRKKVRGNLTHLQRDELGPLIDELERAANATTALPDQKVKFFVVDYPRQFWIRLVTRIAPDASLLFRSLSQEQWKHFEESLQESSKEWLALRDVPEDEYLAEQAKHLEDRTDRLEEWIGELTEQQRKQFFTLNRVSRSTYLSEANTLLRSQEELIDGIKARLKKGDLAAFLIRWAKDPPVSDPKTYWAVRTARDQRRLATWTFLEETLTKEHRAFRKRKFESLRRDLIAFRSADYRE